MFLEGARDAVVQFFQRQDVKQANCEARDNQGWLLLKSLLLLTADSSVSNVSRVICFNYTTKPYTELIVVHILYD